MNVAIPIPIIQDSTVLQNIKPTQDPLGDTANAPGSAVDVAIPIPIIQDFTVLQNIKQLLAL